MNNIILFIRRYFNFIFFCILQITCIVFLVKFNDTYHAAYAGVANEITGSVNTEFNKVQNYFHLRENNRQLLEENTRLKNLLGLSFEGGDTAHITVLDSLIKDTLGRQRKYLFMPAKVVNNTISQQLNYVILHRGANQGVKKDMAVVCSQGVVGTVVDVSDNYSKVMSLLHRSSKVSAMLQKQKVTGSIEWDGQDPKFLTLRYIPKTTTVAKGDSVVTSIYSATFPSNIMIGTVDLIEKDPGSNFYIIRVKASTNFLTLEYVNLVENVQLAEQRSLEAAEVKNQ